MSLSTSALPLFSFILFYFIFYIYFYIVSKLSTWFFYNVEHMKFQYIFADVIRRTKWGMSCILYQRNERSRPRSVRRMGISLETRIVIMLNKEWLNEIVILIPQFGDKTYSTIRIDSKLLK